MPIPIVRLSPSIAATTTHYLYGCYWGRGDDVHYILAAAHCDTTAANAAVHAAVAYYRRYYSNTIATDVIANTIAAVISTAVAATVAVKF